MNEWWEFAPPDRRLATRSSYVCHRTEKSLSRTYTGHKSSLKGSIHMLYTIALVLVILWLCGLVTSYTMGGFIHILLVIAIVVVLLRLINGRAVI